MIEPTSLLSRLMAFVLAGCLTILIIMIVTLSQMFPLERTQIFFLASEPKSDQVISIKNFNVDARDLATYKENFIKEYIIARNQIVPSYPVMRRKWRADAIGSVFVYSSPDIYADFMKTDMWNAIMIGRYEPLAFRCDVSFYKTEPRRLGGAIEQYAVKLRYICADESTGQSEAKDFTIAISVAFQSNVNWNERLDNPLGLKVVGYEIEDGGRDPLNVL